MPQGQGNASGGNNTEQNHVVDFNAARSQKLEEKRTKTERIFFKHLLSVYSVGGNATMYPIELIDLSEDGCSFQIPFDPNKPWPQDMNEFPARLYFSQDTYLEIRMRITNSRPFIETGVRYTRYGCEIDKETSSYAAYQQFVRFLKLYSEHAHKDMGDITVFYL